jgi:hypothetical protein
MRMELHVINAMESKGMQRANAAAKQVEADWTRLRWHEAPM